MNARNMIACSVTPPRASTSPRTHRFFSRVNAKATEGSIYIYDEIGAGWFGGVAPKDVASALDGMTGVKTLNVYINSPGGDVFDAIAIHTLLARFAAKKIMHVDSLCASAATLIAMAGDVITTAANGTWMIHNPWGMAMGSADDMRKTAELLDQVRATILDTYVQRTNGDAKKISAWMTEETWMTAAQAKERGFTDEITDEKTSEDSAAFANALDRYKHTPQNLRAQASAPMAILADLVAAAKTQNLSARLAARTKQNEAAASGGKRQ